MPGTGGSGFLRARVDVGGTAGSFSCIAGGGLTEIGGPVYSGHDDGKIIVWESSGVTKRYVVSTGIYKVVSLALPQGRGKGVWTGFGTGRIAVYDTSVWDSWVLVREFVAHSVGSVVVPGSSAGVGAMITDYAALVTTGNLFVVSCAMDVGQIKVWDGFLEKDWLEAYTKEREDQFCSYREIGVFVGSWNINACKPDSLEALPSSEQVLDQWFLKFAQSHQLESAPAIIAIGFQELVDLESKKANAKQMLFEAMESTGVVKSVPKSGDNRMGYWRDRIVRALSDCLPHVQYRLLECHSLFGLFQCVFLKEEEHQKCVPASISVSQVKTGMGGFHGNKGGIGLRIVLEDSSFCFVNCHMAAHQSHVSARNNDVISIRDQISFTPMRATDGVFVQGGDGSLVLDHENIFFSGDLNYRIDMDRDKVLGLIKLQSWGDLLAKDQLTDQFVTNSQFGLRGFSEGPIRFAPTFKYDINSNNYDTSDKKRVPAWCDRILWKGRSISQVSYERNESTMSDHRPISSLFTVRVKHVNGQAFERIRADAQQAAQIHFGSISVDILRVRGVSQ
ncbi:Endonuclease/exonuclease/phosphatase [Chytriomyces sp. MP71]|nr:Endonuclease/exonuclease/phosphatase [Chytriomyces sp. MP71]